MMARLAFVSFVLGVLATAGPTLGQCTVSGSTGSGGEVVSCAGTDNDGYLGTDFGDEITIQTGADVSDDDPAIDSGGGEDEIVMQGGMVMSTNSNAIDAGSDNDIVTINGGTVTGALGSAIELGSGVDTLIVTGGTITALSDGVHDVESVQITGGMIYSGDQDGIDTSDGNDNVSISNATVQSDGADPSANAIELNSGDDTLTLGSGANIVGQIDGRDDTDTLVFAMEVPAMELAAVQAAIAGADPAGDTLMINGLTYTFINFESLIDNVTVPTNVLEVPTLSPNSIALFGLLLGCAGWLVLRRF